MPRRLLLGLVALAAVGLGVRWAWVLGVDPAVPDVGDATAYHLLADGLADGDGYVRPFDRVLFGVERPTAEYAPVHPAVVAAADLAGIDAVTGQRLWLSLFGAASVIVTGALAWRLSGGRQAPALAAAAVAAVHPLWFQADATLMPETLAGLLGGGAVLAAVERRWLLTGALVGLAALTRGEALVLLPIVLAAAVRPRPRAALVALGAFAIVVAPWSLRNAARFDEAVLLSTNVGSVLDGANCPATYGGPLLGYWQYGPGCFEGFLQDELAAADESVVADAHRHQGTTFATDHVDDWPKVVGARLARTVALFRPSQLADLGALEGREQAADLAGYALVWASLAGAAVALLRRQVVGDGRWIPVAAVAAVWGSTALSYGNPRFLAVAQPSLVALAACAVRRTATTR